MKEKIRLATCALLALFLFSCGNNKEATPPSEEATDVEVSVSEPEEVVVEEITLSFTRAKDPCFGNEAEYLHVKGGKPFEDEANPYKVEAKNTKQGSIELGKFVKKDDGTFTMDIPGTASFADDEVTIQVVVTDANGSEKTIDYVIPYCP